MTTTWLFPIRILACALPVVAGNARAQQAVPALDLRRPAWTAPESFTMIVAVHELPNGAVLVIDEGDRILHLIAPGGRTARRLGRTGSGPREYTWPQRLVALRGDSVLLVDREAQRYLPIDAGGGLHDAIRFPDAMGSGAERIRGADQLGRIYFQSSSMPPSPSGPPSVEIKRWERTHDRIETVATLSIASPQAVEVKLPKEVRAEAPQLGPSMAVRRIQPFSPRDQWGVAPSGRVALLRVHPYHIEWLELDGRITRGADVSYVPVAVTNADKLLVEPNGPPFRLMYPPTKPPFGDEPMIPVIDDRDNVWVRRAASAGAKESRWDVFNAQGQAAGSMTLPAKKRLTAITKRFVYVVRTDDDDLQWLEAYAR